jgi:hypothetical protein
MNYTLPSRMIERNQPPQHSTRNYLKCFCPKGKRSLAGGVRKQFDDKGKKRPHKCMDVFDDNSDEEDDNYSRHLASELVYSEAKVEAV